VHFRRCTTVHRHPPDGDSPRAHRPVVCLQVSFYHKERSCGTKTEGGYRFPARYGPGPNCVNSDPVYRETGCEKLGFVVMTGRGQSAHAPPRSLPAPEREGKQSCDDKPDRRIDNGRFLQRRNKIPPWTAAGTASLTRQFPAGGLYTRTVTPSRRSWRSGPGYLILPETPDCLTRKFARPGPCSSRLQREIVHHR